MIVISNTTKKNISKKKILDAINLVLSHEHYSSEYISAVYCGDKFIKKINREFLHHDFPTDTISFRLNSGKKIEGEFYISLDTIARNARQYKVDQQTELLRVTIHSVLHLIGYNDCSEKEKFIMTKKENDYLAKFPFRTT